MAAFHIVLLALIALSAPILGKPTPDDANQPHVQPAVRPAVLTAPVPHSSSESGENQSTVNPVARPARDSGHAASIDLQEVHSVTDAAGAPGPAPVPAVGNCPKIFAPVCGSDNKTYNTKCELQAAQRSNSALTMAKVGAC